MPIMSVYKFLLKLIMIQSTSVAESFFLSQQMRTPHIPFNVIT